MTASEPGKWDRSTSINVRKMRQVIDSNGLRGFTSVVMLGRIGVSKAGDVTVDNRTSVNMY
jgi:hypothetical protein